ALELYFFADFFMAAHRFLCASAILARASGLSLRFERLRAAVALLLPDAAPALERSFFTS
ncbi:MAG: hypothetical protein ABSE96_23790, partial [Terracidiphilus sp.]